VTSSQLRIVVGISGGIAAYKAVGVVRAFVKDGHHVDVIATAAALEFVGRPTLEAISRNPVHVGLYDDVAQVRHVALGQQADVVVIAPATANTLASIANGLAPDLLGNTVLARRGPLVVAPAMHTEMWQNPATQHNVGVLRDRGVHIVGPGVGELTGADSGEGRMSEVDEIVSAAYAAVTHPHQDLLGKRILISAGGTREMLDPVRFLGNRSSGHMAAALAQAALARGASVTVVAAYTEALMPAGAAMVSAPTALEMQDAMTRFAGESDIVVMAAAVADYRPAEQSDEKLKKSALGQSPTIQLVQNPDILAELGSGDRAYTLVGFAAETADEKDALVALAAEKLAAKGCDFLVVNHVGSSAGFGDVPTSVAILDRTGRIIEESSGAKLSVAHRIFDSIS
jgi:phosphopantothenoylcysteine decarboxylase/phosphopantothenate--cysteine ligase